MSHVIRVLPSEKTYNCEDDDTLLRSGLRAGLGMPYECNVGACGTCKYELVSGEVETLWEEAPGLSARDHGRGRKLLCQSRPRSDCTIRAVLNEKCVPRHPPRKIKAKLLSRDMLTGDMAYFAFDLGTASPFLPGQYALFTLPGIPGLRAYSMANAKGDRGIWEFIIRRLPEGAATGFLFEKLAIGDKVSMDGPYGLAYFREDSPRHAILLAGGSGLAPILSVARAIAEKGGIKAYVFYGGRGPSDLVAEKLLQDLPAFGERIFCFSAPSVPELAQEAGWTGKVCFVHELLQHTLPKEVIAEAEVYLAGPPPMVEAALKLLAMDYRLPTERIHFDRFF